ncbi:MAG TPA: LOG family protein [Thermoguttaceae bacterium]
MTEDQEREINLQNILHSLSYRVAYKDVDFLAEPELRAARMELELLKPELYFQRNNIRSTIVVFGSTRIVKPDVAQEQLERARALLVDTPNDVRRQRAVARAEEIAKLSHYYETAHHFARLVSTDCQSADRCDYVVITGGGPGIMEAANRGAYEVGAKSIGMNIRLPQEQQPNPYITPELCFQFHYFAIRKFHFLLRAKALVVFPGGFGTIDELFDALTLRQTRRMQEIPIIMFGREYWQRAINFTFMADAGIIDDSDLDLFRYADTAEEAWKMIKQFHLHRRSREMGLEGGSEAWPAE